MLEFKQHLGSCKLAIAATLLATSILAGCRGAALPANGTGSSSSSATDSPLGPSAVLSVSDRNLSFGDVTVGTATSQLVSLTNIGTANLKISSVSVSGQGYSVSGGSNKTLTPAQSVTISVNFGPSTSGFAGGSLAIKSDASNPMVNVGISGIGVTSALSPHGVQLSWTPAPTDVAGYFVYRSTVSGGPYSKLNATAETQDSFADSGLASGTYFYVVTSVDPGGAESSYSNQVEVVVP